MCITAYDSFIMFDTMMAALKGVLGYRGIGQILRGILDNFVNIKSIL